MKSFFKIIFPEKQYGPPTKLRELEYESHGRLFVNMVQSALTMMVAIYLFQLLVRNSQDVSLHLTIPSAVLIGLSLIIFKKTKNLQLSSGLMIFAISLVVSCRQIFGEAGGLYSTASLVSYVPVFLALLFGNLKVAVLVGLIQLSVFGYAFLNILPFEIGDIQYVRLGITIAGTAVFLAYLSHRCSSELMAILDYTTLVERGLVANSRAAEPRRELIEKSTLLQNQLREAFKNESEDGFNSAWETADGMSEQLKLIKKEYSVRKEVPDEVSTKSKRLSLDEYYCALAKSLNLSACIFGPLAFIIFVADTGLTFISFSFLAFPLNYLIRKFLLPEHEGRTFGELSLNLYLASFIVGLFGIQHGYFSIHYAWVPVLTFAANILFGLRYALILATVNLLMLGLVFSFLQATNGIISPPSSVVAFSILLICSCCGYGFFFTLHRYRSYLFEYIRDREKHDAGNALIVRICHEVGNALTGITFCFDKYRTTKNMKCFDDIWPQLDRIDSTLSEFSEITFDDKLEYEEYVGEKKMLKNKKA